MHTALIYTSTVATLCNGYCIVASHSCVGYACRRRGTRGVAPLPEDIEKMMGQATLLYATQ
jgi:hypothetical protein